MADETWKPPPEHWQNRDVPTVFADIVLGSATVEGVIRITLGEVIFDPRQGATHPTYRPAINLVMPRTAVEFLARQVLGEADAVATDEPAAE